jgi:hypothetical protein
MESGVLPAEKSPSASLGGSGPGQTQICLLQGASFDPLLNSMPEQQSTELPTPKATNRRQYLRTRSCEDCSRLIAR